MSGTCPRLEPQQASSRRLLWQGRQGDREELLKHRRRDCADSQVADVELALLLRVLRDAGSDTVADDAAGQPEPLEKGLDGNQWQPMGSPPSSWIVTAGGRAGRREERRNESRWSNRWSLREVFLGQLAAGERARGGP